MTAKRKDNTAMMNTVTALVLTLTAIVLYALGYYAHPLLLVVLALFVPMLFAGAYAKTNVWGALSCLALFGAVAWLISGPTYTLVALASTLPIMLICGEVIRHRMTFYYSVMAGCIATLLGLVMLVVTVQYGWHTTPDGVLVQYVEGTLWEHPDTTKLYYALFGLVEGGAIPAGYTFDFASIMAVPLDTAVQGVMRSMEPALRQLVPQAGAAMVALFGLLNYIVPRAVVKKTGGEVGAVPVFSRWGLPNRFGTWSVVLLVVAWVGLLAEWNNFELVYAIVMGILTVVYSIQGMAFIDWLLKKKVDVTVGRVLVIAITFMLGSLINLYMWIGFFEQLAKIRKKSRLKKSEEK